MVNNIFNLVIKQKEAKNVLKDMLRAFFELSS